MHVALLSALHCPAPHAPTPLVTAVVARDADRVLSGTVGCPTCGLMATVSSGRVAFPPSDPPPPAAPMADATDAFTAAAMLDATSGVVALAPAWASVGAALAAATPATVILVAPPPGTATDGCTVFEGTRVPPLAPGTCRGVALDLGVADDPPTLARWLGAVAADGRIVAPVAVPRPPGVRELARDDAHWVGVAERRAAPVPLMRAPRGAP